MEHAGHDAAMQQHMKEMQAHRRMTLWAHFANVTLGLWLISSPVTLGFLYSDLTLTSEILRVNAERDLSSLAFRNWAMAWSDWISGFLIVVFGFLALSRRFAWAQWVNTFVGIWLLFAPIVFWTPSPAAYLNDTLVGTLVITFSILIPMMPGMSMQAMARGPEVPPGWAYSPSTWVQRTPIVAFAFIGFLVARYLSAYQMGHIKGAWDPFFGHGTVKIITSDVSRAWPVPDAGLGAVSYLIEALSGLMGGASRWRTMPWMVLMFGVLVVPLGAVSIFFIIIQPIVIGTWCTLCLFTAAIMVIMIPYSLDEVVAMGQFMVQAKHQGQSLWQVFWHGGSLPGGAKDPDPDFESPPGQVLKSMTVGGVSFPWTLLASAALGVWLMFTRLIFGTEGNMADSDHLIGALTFVVAFSAMAEVGRALRFINVLFGFWLLIAPWVLDGASVWASWASVAAGLILIGLSIPRGPVHKAYGSWDRFIR